MPYYLLFNLHLGRQVAQLVERRTLEVEIRCSKPALCTWWWGRTSTSLSSWFFGAAMANLRLQNLPFSAINRKFYYFSPLFNPSGF